MQKKQEKLIFELFNANKDCRPQNFRTFAKLCPSCCKHASSIKYTLKEETCTKTPFHSSLIKMLQKERHTQAALA
jgi:hypothetical protein